MAELQPGSQVDRFRLVRRLGQGGMATTFLADDLETGQTVVLKFPEPKQLGDAATFERFRREHVIASKLAHPAVPRLIAVREDGHHPYLALEYIDGEPLNERLDAGPLPVAEVVDLARQLADLLAYCHGLGVAHRDLKPENLLITPDGKLHVIDFGIAKVAGMPRVTWRGFSGLAGTPEYMAPEQIRGEPSTERVDIYAVGITLYQMLAGQVPYKAEHPMSTMYLHLEGEAPPLRERRPEVPPYLAAIVARCMRRRPAERYRDGGALLSDLVNPVLVDVSVLERPDPPMGGSRGLRLGDNPLTHVVIAAVVGLVAVFALLLAFAHKRH